MSSHLSRRERRRSAIVIATCLLALSIPSLSIGACAVSTEASSSPIDASHVLDPVDAGDGSVSDGDLVDADDPALPCAVGNLCRVSTPLQIGSVSAISGRSKDDVWAGGSRGVLMHWSGQQWISVDSGIQETLSSIFLTPDELWGVSGSLVLRRGADSSSVRTARFNSADMLWISGVAALSDGDAYMSISPGYTLTSVPQSLANITDFDAGQFEYAPAPILTSTNQPQEMAVRALFFVPEKTLWLVGDRGAVARYRVSPLREGVLLPVSSQASLYAAWGHDEHLWAAGSDGTILHFDGTDWHTEDSGTNDTLNAIFGFSSEDIWAAGDNGTVLHFDGKHWSHVAVGSYVGKLVTIWGAAPDDVWIGGERAMFHWGAVQ
jgi:hypothetical protein